VAPFSDEQDVVARANDTEFGLVAYLYTQHHSRIMRLLPRLEYGMVAVNGVKITGATAPFGGVKQSGLGREGGQVGIDEFTQLQYVCMAVDEPDNAARGVV